jgi:hypothetical protein
MLCIWKCFTFVESSEEGLESVNGLIPSRFEVFTAVLLNTQVLWYVVPCHLVVPNVLKDCTAVIFSVK